MPINSFHLSEFELHGFVLTERNLVLAPLSDLDEVAIDHFSLGGTCFDLGANNGKSLVEGLRLEPL